jgi:cell shape-determining protein MreD
MWTELQNCAFFGAMYDFVYFLGLGFLLGTAAFVVRKNKERFKDEENYQILFSVFAAMAIVFVIISFLAFNHVMMAAFYPNGYILWRIL